MAAAIVPVVFSLNRGLWLSLGLALMYAMFRFWLRGDFRQALKVILAFAVVGVILVVSPLGNLATSRFSHKTGDTGRIGRDLGAQEKIANSPILGFGAPLGAVQSPTHKQSNLGTESEIFLLVFSHGVPGPRALPDLDLLHALPIGEVEVAVVLLGPRHDPRGLHPAALLRHHGADPADDGGGGDRLPRDRAQP